MMLRIQQERMQGAFVPSLRGVAQHVRDDAERVARAKPDVIIMHPGPMNRGVEIASDVADGPYSGDSRAGRQRRRRCGWRCCICWSAMSRRTDVMIEA